MASRTAQKTSKQDQPQMLHVTWYSGTEAFNLADIENLAGAAAPFALTTMEIRAGDLIVEYRPALARLPGTEDGFTLTYDHPGTWRSGESIGKDADGDLGTATYKREKAEGPDGVKWTCSWQGKDGASATPKCRLSAPSASRVYAKYARAVRDGAFRAAILRESARCAISGETEQCVLDAAHILPVSRNGRDEVTNGLALRKDLHALFDAGHLGIDEDGKFTLHADLPLYKELIGNASILGAASVPAVRDNIRARNAGD